MRLGYVVTPKRILAIMANSSGALHDKLGSLSKTDLLPNKKEVTKEEVTVCSKTPTAAEICEIPTESLIQRCVIIQRDEKGYGLTVSGDNPVFVQSVKQDGAAARAGVQEGDRIIKVNGTLVTQSNHQEVVKLIKSGSYVALTLLGKSPGPSGGRPISGSNQGPPLPISLPSHSPIGGVHSNNSKLSSSSERITGPQPVDPEKQQEVTNTRIHTIKKMFDKDVIFLENLQAEHAKNPTELIQQQIHSATKRVKVLEEQLSILIGYQLDHSAPRSPRSPPLLRQCHSENAPRSSPAQGKSLTHQVSAPTLPKSDRSPSSGSNVTTTSLPFEEWDASQTPLPASSHLPPPHHKQVATGSNRNPGTPVAAGGGNQPWGSFPAARQISVSTSCENLTKHGKATTWPHIGGPTHSRQSSSPEALLHNIRLTQPLPGAPHPHHVMLDGGRRPSPSEHSLTRSHSELGREQPHTQTARKMSASETLREQMEGNNTSGGSKRWRPANLPSRGSSFRHHLERSLESPRPSPPATPPPTAFDFSRNATENSGGAMENEGIDVDEYNPEEDFNGAACYPMRMSLSMHDLPRGSATVVGRMPPPTLADVVEALSPIVNHSTNYNEFRALAASTPEYAAPLNLEYGTPPEEQSSPISSMNKQNLSSKHGQTPYIVCMEDDEMSSDGESHMDDHGPFKSLWKLLKNQAHLAVFMQYLLQNRSPASLFFYIIANHYEDGTGKEMKKWAYEIHSSFLVPGAPLRVTNIDEAILLEIDDVLQNHLEKEDLLRTLFRKAKEKAKELLNTLLAEFRNKRAIGLGNIYGPNDYRLEEAIHDKNKELKIIEQVLVPSMEKISDDPDTMSDEEIALASSLATVLKQFGVKNQPAMTFYDKWPSFVAKEKSRLKFLQRNKKSMSVQNHQFVPQHYCCVTYCNHCQNIIWGVGNQGYQCQHCEMNIHKACVKVVEESCIGAFRSKKDKRRDRMSGIMENIIGKSRKPSHPNVSAIEKAKRLNEESQLQNSDYNNYHDTSHLIDGEKNSRVDRLRERFELGNDDVAALGIPPGISDAIDRGHHIGKKGGLGRSESFRTRRESRPSFRKRSDPNIPRSKSDVEVDDKSNLNNSGSSSNSSLSARYEGSLDSPSNSQEMVHRTPSTLTAESISSNVTSTTTTTLHQYDDSDLEAETDPPNWQENVSWDVLRLMKPKEKKRQDVINELFHTERTHVRNLKVLERMFYRPFQADQLLPTDQLQLLFPNLEEMIDIHGRFNEQMKAQRRDESVIGNIGDAMLQMLDGHSGECLRKAAALFCKNQSVALECLKSRQRKDQKLALFLAEAEGNNMCRRLQLKDIIVTGFQRLTKYPLLLENVAKHTAPNSVEHANLLKAVECSRQILAHVNQAVKEAENQHRLNELQKNLEKSSFVKTEHPIVNQYKMLDLTQHRLLYEGSLTWKLNRQKSIEVHMVLLEEILVLFLKQDEKFVLKFQNINIMTSKEDAKMPHSPILKVRNLIPRYVATDKRGFFLLSASDQHAMYEFAAASAAEKKIWFTHITDAINAYGSHNEPSKIPEPSILSDRTESTEDNEEIDSRVKDNSLGGDTSVESFESNHLSSPSVPSDSTNNSTSEVPGVESPPEENPNPPPEVTPEPPPPPPPLPPLEKPPSPTAAAPPQSPSPKEDEEHRPQQRRMQRVEILKIADGPTLIEPYEVVIRPSAILQTAEPVLTPVERLKRKDVQIALALAEKEELVAKILQVPKEEFQNIVEMTEEVEGEKDSQELLLAAIHQANRLTKLLNETLRVTEEDAISATSVEDVRNSPSPKIGRKYGRLVGSTTASLRSISSHLNRHLTQLLTTVSSREQERKQLRKELHHSREQIHQMHEVHRYCSVRSRSPSSRGAGAASQQQQSRPNSFVSVASSSEGTCDLHPHHSSTSSSDELLLAHLLNVNNHNHEVAQCPSGIEDQKLLLTSLQLVEASLSTSSLRVDGEDETLRDDATSQEKLEDADDEEQSRIALTTSMTSDEMFVDAPANLDEETLSTVSAQCPVTDLDSSDSADEQQQSQPPPNNHQHHNTSSSSEISTNTVIEDSLREKEDTKKDVSSALCSTAIGQQSEATPPELVVNPIYF